MLESFKVLKTFILALVSSLLVSSGGVRAAVISFDIRGNAGYGLLGGNENPVVSGGGSGGETGPGIFFDLDTNDLTINVGWGSQNGFTDLSGPASAMHIHKSAGFGINGPVVVDLSSLVGFSNNAMSGGFSGTVNLTDDLKIALFDGNLYLNVHTASNPGGEIRGNLRVVPEPSMCVIFTLIGLSGVSTRLRARHKLRAL